MSDLYREWEKAKQKRPRCAKCGAELFDDPAANPARLCPAHRREAELNCPPFADGPGTGATPGCRCDGPCWACGGTGSDKLSGGRCEACDGYGTRCCEMPCWQRLGLTAEPCCPDCPALPEPEPEPTADVIPLTPLRAVREETG